MRRDQVIDARRELYLRQVAAAGKHDETSVRQRGSEQFGIPRRRRNAVFRHEGRIETRKGTRV